MTSILVYRPERHPDGNKINELGIPIIPPTLCRTVNMKKLLHNNREGLKDYLNSYSFIKKIIIRNNKLYVKVFVDKVDHVHEHIQRIFRDGIHTLSNKIWKIENSIKFMTNLEAEKFINNDFCSTLNYYFCFDSKYDYITYIIHMQ